MNNTNINTNNHYRYMATTQTHHRYMTNSTLEEYAQHLNRCLQLPVNFGNCYMYETFLLIQSELASRGINS